MTIVLCTAKYSDNLGDGVIAECQKSLLIESGERDIREIDIAGRQGYSVGESRSRLKQMFYRTPIAVRRAIVVLTWILWRKRRAKSQWVDALAGADLLVIGGGQLIQDDYLNFPLKLQLLGSIARKHQLAVAISCIGVGSQWSRVGRMLVRQAFRDVEIVHVSVRDDTSQKNLKELMGIEARRVADAALAASLFYPVFPRSNSEKLRVGIGVAHPEELRLGSGKYLVNSWSRGWTALANSLVDDGAAVTVFTNGSVEDQLFADSLDQLHPSIVRRTRPKRPCELVEILSKFDVVIAHRLHSNIISCALHVKPIALSWDAKVDGFMRLVDQAEWIFSAPEDVAGVIGRRLRSPLPDLHDLQRLLFAEARELVAKSRRWEGL